MIIHDRVSENSEKCDSTKELKLIIVDPCFYSREGLIEALRIRTEFEKKWQISHEISLSNLLSIISIRQIKKTIKINTFNFLVINLPPIPTIALSLLLQLREFEMSRFDRVTILSDFNNDKILDIFIRIGGNVNVSIESSKLPASKICDLILLANNLDNIKKDITPHNKSLQLSNKECIALLLMLQGEPVASSAFKFSISRKTIYSRRHSGLIKLGETNMKSLLNKL